MNKLLGGRYEILEKIGEGGMAMVYKARCRILNRYVAIKLLKPEFVDDEKFIENFRKESQAAASLSHPNIVNIYDEGFEGKNIHYIVMEYVEGETLSSIIEREGKLSDEATIHIAKQIASALSAAHKKNIIHRDIKSHNILISKDGTAKITDFGIAKAVGTTTMVANDSMMGSVHYFSPEQARGGYVDGKSDIYSLGIVMYEMVTGRVPFDGENPVSIAMMHINDAIKTPSFYTPDMSPDLEEIIMRATEKFAVNRFTDAEELYNALDYISSYQDNDAFITDFSEPSDEASEDEENDENQNDIDDESMDYENNDEVEDELDETSDAESEDVNSEDAGDIDDESVEDEFDSDDNSEQNFEVDGQTPPIQEKKKRRFLPRLLGIFLGIAVALGASIGIMYAVDYFKTPEVAVPDLLGLTYQQAQQELAKNGLLIEKGEAVFSQEYAEDLICSQNPDKDTVVKEGTTIIVSLSKGENANGIPDLIGKLYEDAVKIIEGTDYVIGQVTEKDDAALEGTIISQTPEGGAEAKAGATIDLVISTGKSDKVTMISLLGYSVDRATSALQNSGLVLKNVEYDYSNSYDEGEVMSQSIDPGKTVAAGTSITLTISRGEKPFGTSGGTTATVPLVLDYTLASDDVFQIKINLVQDGKVTMVHDAIHYKENVGEGIDITGSGTATVQIYFDNKLVSEGEIDFESGKFSY